MRVDGARRLDEDEDLRVGQQGAGKHEPLPLPAGERPAALVDDLVQAGRERDQDVLGGGDLDRVGDLGCRSTGSTGRARWRSVPGEDEADRAR